MTTPSPGTSTPSGGVAPPDGYTTDTGEMTGAGRVIGNAAEDAQGEVEDLQPTVLAQADFGTAHTEWHADYAAGIAELGAGATAMCTNLLAFAGQIGGAGSTYATTETGATGTVSAPGSGL